MPIFETASRIKLRFDSNKGKLTTEDLWSLPLTATTRNNQTDLDTIAKACRAALRDAEDTSFVNPTKIDETLQLRFDIVKHIIDVKIQERDDRKKAAEKKALKQKIHGIIQDKRDAELSTKSIEDLEKMINDL